MDQLRAYLEEKTADGTPGLPTVWFEAWKYDQIPDVRNALLHRILVHMQEQVGQGVSNKIAEALRVVSELGVGLFTKSRLSINLPVGVGVNLPTSEELAQSWERDHKGLETAVDQIEKAFAEAVTEFLGDGESGGQNRKLVVFIDDLDRCLPENVITILEALKLFLDKSPCVFVVGVDRRVVERAIVAHYGHDPGVSGREYLDKIIQYPCNLPVPNQSQLEERFAAGKLASEERLSLSLSAHGNPRVYLRLLSTYRLVSVMAPQFNFSMDDPLDKRTLLFAVALQVRFPGFAELCQSNIDGFYVFDEFLHNSRQSSLDNPALGASRASEFRPFWDDGSLKHFLISYRDGMMRKAQLKDPKLCTGPREKLRNALSLAATAD